MRDLVRYNLQTVRAYLLKEDFQQFWEYNSHLGRHVPRLLDLPDYALSHRADEEIARSLRKHRTLILNYSKAQKGFSSGVVERETPSNCESQARAKLRLSCLTSLAGFEVIPEAESTGDVEALLTSERNGRRMVLDLKDVIIVNQDAVSFLQRCEADSITLKNCPVKERGTSPG